MTLDASATIYLPFRTHQSGSIPVQKMGDGHVALNIPDRRLWISEAGEIVEVTDLGQLIDYWIRVIERH